MDLGESKIYLCLVALCCGPTQEDADFLRSLGTLLRVPLTEQASCITMLTAVSQSSNPFQMAEELALKLRENIDQNTALEKFCMLFLLCFYPPDPATIAAASTANQQQLNQRQMEKLYQHVQFNAKTSVIFRRLAFLLRIKLTTVTKLETMAIEHWQLMQNSFSNNDAEDDSAISASTGGASDSTRNSTTSSKRSRRKGVIRGLKIGATAAGAGVLLGVTGGLAAPALAAGLAHIGLGAAATLTTTASVAAILGTGGAGLAGYKMNRRLKVVKTFEFHAINQAAAEDDDQNKEKENNTGMTVYVCVSGYLRSPGPVLPKLKNTSNQKEQEENTKTNSNNKKTAEEEESSSSPAKQGNNRREGNGRRGLFGRRRNNTDKEDMNMPSTGNTDADDNNDNKEEDIPDWMQQFTGEDEEVIEVEGGKRQEEGKQQRRGLFRRRGRKEQQDSSSAQSPNNSSNNNNNKSPSKSLLGAKSSAATSPEFYEPWGAQPPVMFPQHVLDRYYAVVAPDKRFLVPMLLQKYRKKFKKEQRRLRKQSSNGGDSDEGSADLEDLANSNNTDFLPKPSGEQAYANNSSDDELDADIDYGLTPDDQAFVDSMNAVMGDAITSTSTTDKDGKKKTAEEKLFALLEREYGVHPLQIMEAAESSRKEQQEMEVSTMDMYRSLLEKGQARMESILTVGHSTDVKPAKTVGDQTDLLNDPIENPHVVEMMNLVQNPWDKPFTMEDRQKDDAEANNNPDGVGDEEDVLIKLDEDNTDEEQVNKIIEDLNNLFVEIDDPDADTKNKSADNDNEDDQISSHELSLNEEMQKLEIDTTTGSNSKGRHEKFRRKLFGNKAKQLKAKADQATDIYWWRESVARTGDQYTLIWEPKILLECGRCVENLVKESASKGALSALQFTALAPIILTMTLPVVILSVVTILDNYWSVATAAADEAGELLADALLSGAHGNRPVVLVGYSVGGRVVASCLRSLARVAESRDDRDDDDGGAGDEPEIGGVSSGNKDASSSPSKQQRGGGGGGLRDFMTNTKARKARAKTIVRDAVIIGAPLDCNTRRWTRRRSVVQGRLINVYNSKDWVLALLYRYKSWSVVKLAGLKPVQCNPIDGLPSIENYNVSDIVTGHDKYHARIREILDRVGVGDVNCEHTHSHYFSTGVVEILKEEPKQA